MMRFFELLWYLFRHLNETAAWNNLIEHVGQTNIYVVMFAIIFAETGLVILPFLPGDSLLFALGAIGMKEGIAINLWVITPLLIAAAIVGDAVNYWIGYKIGPAIFSRGGEDDAVEANANAPVATGQLGYAPRPASRSLMTRLLNKKHLIKAQEFYDKYGGKTIILARFVPIVRTFAPFVAGIGRMNFFKFWIYNIVGGAAWVIICVLAGVFFGRFEVVQKNFELVIIAIILISVLPVAIEFWKARRAAKAAGPVAEPHPTTDAAIQAATTLPAVEEDAGNR
ncbi:MAG: VTT domain-containing protein [Phycisphaerae bacterium]|nr:VTT domain-containing protein [Tepidisphaeraceae bacterium]